MDPASAIGVASSVLAFIDFSVKLVKGAVEIYRDGTTSENARIEDVVRDLKVRSEAMKASKTAKTEAEKSIVKLAEECHKVSGSSLALLEQMSVKNQKHSKLGSLKAALITSRKRKTVAEFQAQLQEYRAQILLNLQLVLQEDQSAIALQLNNVQIECQGMRTDFAGKIEGMRTDVLQDIQASQKTALDADSHTHDSLEAIARKLLDIQSAIVDVPVHHRILRHLVYDSMSARCNQVHSAEPDTCRWILDEDFDDSTMEKFGLSMIGDEYPFYTKWKKMRLAEEKSDRGRIREQFLKWLKAGDGILHISGNAGSGKSTLMRFIHNHERTKQELLTWAGAKKLVVGQFFFWSAGSDLQKTEIGLLKSLLFQVLSQYPELIGDVFPIQLARLRMQHGSQAVEAVEEFNDGQIRKAFDLFFGRTSHANHRFCFFIDGLDEYDGDEIAHEQFAEKLKSWTTSGDLKLCVSSRPWTEFLTTFESPHFPTIHLHLLNRFDIETYCVEQLTQDKFAGQNLDMCQRLAEEIVENARGIFLWAHLVVHDALLAIRRGGTKKAILAQVQAMPPKLNDLYKKLREPLEGNQALKIMSNRMLLLAACYEEPGLKVEMNAMVFSWLEDEEGRPGLTDIDFPPATECQPYSDHEIATRLKKVTQQVNGLARGLLAVTTMDEKVSRFYDTGLLSSFSSTRVRFCHKTARDYVLGECYDSLRRDFPNFDAVYARSFIAEYMYGRELSDPYLCEAFWRLAPPSFAEVANLEMFQKIEIIVRPVLRPFWKFSDGETSEKRTAVSILHWAARWGGRDVARTCVNLLENARSSDHVDSQNLTKLDIGTSILVAVAPIFTSRVYVVLGLEVLNKRLETNILVDATSDGVAMKLPAWIIAFIDAVQYVLPGQNPQWSMQQNVELITALHTYSLELDQLVTLTVGGLTNL